LSVFAHYDLGMPLILEPDDIFKPPHEDARLWRYMDIPKYLQMLSSCTIWFSRADQLGDPFEGSTTKIAKEALISHVQSQFPGQQLDSFSYLVTKSAIESRYFTYINSWHLSPIESAAMWNLYRKDYGISVVTTVQKLNQSLSSDERIRVGLVNYIDYEISPIDWGYMSSPFVHKRKSFEHEKEVRLVIFSVDASKKLFDYPAIETRTEFDDRIPFGIAVPANLEKLILEVRIDPNAPPWFMATIADVTKKMGFGFEVIQSVLGEDPVF